MDFRTRFREATGSDPFPYQERLADSVEWPTLLEIPTGLGKTAATILSWLHARAERNGATPRRLVYCLPMRVLVDQTVTSSKQWVDRLGMRDRIRILPLMGGSVAEDCDWDVRPEDEAIIVGTQDMLLSRALNRGYGMSRFRWPLHFGLLNNDCQWLIDEVQLVGAGLATTAQLQALRRKLGTALPVRTTWMSATLEEAWLRTVDVEDIDLAGRESLGPDDRRHPVVQRRIEARKLCSRADSPLGDSGLLAAEVAARHRPGTRTLVIVNTVDRAVELFSQIGKQATKARLVLLHSRFRAPDRRAQLQALLDAPGDSGVICVSTQVIEAGVDVSAATLFTEMAPWASLVQRFGRCNRQGEYEDARVFWIGLPESDREREKMYKPYRLADLEMAQDIVHSLVDVGPIALPRKAYELESGMVLRRRDLLDLFDTTSDLAGNDIDVSRFIRETDDHDLRVFWRDIQDHPDPHDRSLRSPRRDELCAVPLGVVRDWKKQGRPMWRWDALKRELVPVEAVFPGLTLLLRTQDGGYLPAVGLAVKSKASVEEARAPEPARDEDDANDEDPLSEAAQWVTLARHSDEVAAEAGAIATAVGLARPLQGSIVEAARWHDAGKAHPIYQAAARKLGIDPPEDPVAKSQRQSGRITYARRGFRHELASALIALAHGRSDLVCFLVASHHGKVRASIRSLPTEPVPRDSEGRPQPACRFARGIWDGDDVPAVDLGHGQIVPATKLTLSYMELGDDPATGQSWLSRVLGLRDDPDYGPFRLAYFEALLKSADERVSARTAQGGKG